MALKKTAENELNTTFHSLGQVEVALRKQISPDLLKDLRQVRRKRNDVVHGYTCAPPGLPTLQPESEDSPHNSAESEIDAGRDKVATEFYNISETCDSSMQTEPKSKSCVKNVGVVTSRPSKRSIGLQTETPTLAKEFDKCVQTIEDGSNLQQNFKSAPMNGTNTICPPPIWHPCSDVGDVLQQISACQLISHIRSRAKAIEDELSSIDYDAGCSSKSDDFIGAAAADAGGKGDSARQAYSNEDWLHILQEKADHFWKQQSLMQEILSMSQVMPVKTTYPSLTALSPKHTDVQISIVKKQRCTIDVNGLPHVLPKHSRVLVNGMSVASCLEKEFAQHGPIKDIFCYDIGKAHISFASPEAARKSLQYGSRKISFPSDFESYFKEL